MSRSSEVRLLLNFHNKAISVGTIFAVGAKYAFRKSGEADYLNIPGIQDIGPTTEIPPWLADILPDAWGERVMLHEMKKAGISLRHVSVADRLAFIGQSGLGAWQFFPETMSGNNIESIADLHWLREQSILIEKNQDGIVDWMKGSLSLGGARPKVFVDLVDGKPNLLGLAQNRKWILKIPGDRDAPDAGNWEYAYSIMARDFKLQLPESALVDEQYFAVRRFDFDKNGRFLVRSLSSLNGITHKDVIGNSYESVIDHLSVLEGSHKNIDQVVRLALFNHVMLNWDDHGKNISFLMDAHGAWRLAPFYDITPNLGLGAHGMSLNRQTSPEISDFVDAFAVWGYNKKRMLGLLDEIGTIVDRWPQYAEVAMISDDRGFISEVKDGINEIMPRSHRRYADIDSPDDNGLDIDHSGTNHSG